MKCVILQPSYIPWRGYFHQIAIADIFIFLDDVQYDKRGWRNRNRIKTHQGLQWLTIPVHSKGAQQLGTTLAEIPIVWETDWNQDHLKSIYHAYRQAPFFDPFFSFVSELLETKTEFLADFTIQSSLALASYLGIENTTFIRSSSIPVNGTKTTRLINLLKEVGADHYISGPSAEEYIEESLFDANNITLEYMSYEYPEYEQLHPPYHAQVSIIDLLFMQGKKAINYMIRPGTNPA